MSRIHEFPSQCRYPAFHPVQQRRVDIGILFGNQQLHWNLGEALPWRRQTASHIGPIQTGPPDQGCQERKLKQPGVSGAGQLRGQLAKPFAGATGDAITYPKANVIQAGAGQAGKRGDAVGHGRVGDGLPGLDLSDPTSSIFNPI